MQYVMHFPKGEKVCVAAEECFERGRSKGARG